MSIAAIAATPTVCPDITKTALGDPIIIPTGIRAILAIIPYMQIDAGITAAKTKLTKVIIESNDIPRGLAPLELLCNPIGGGLGTALDGYAANPQKYAVNINVTDGARIQAYGQGLQDATTDPIVGCIYIISTSSPVGPQRYGLVGALTGCGANGILTTGGTESVIGATRLVEVCGALASNVLTTLEGYGGILSLQSSQFTPNLPLEFPLNSIGGGIGAAISDIHPGIVRYPVDMALKSPATIEYFCTLYATTITAAPSFVGAIIYE